LNRQVLTVVGSPFSSGRSHTNFQILVGQTNRTHGELIAAPIVIEHEEYDDWELWNDVVILKLDTHLIEDGLTIQRTLLPGPAHYVPAGRSLVVSGFGDLESGSRVFPDILQSVVVPAWSHQACVDIYPDEIIDAGQHLCAGAFGHDACQGDSGSY
jgi:suppressor of tumorigenicity protein 14